MGMSATLIWFLGIFLLTLAISVAAILLGRVRRSRVKIESESSSAGLHPGSPGIGTWGFECSVLGLIVAILLAPGTRYLPETIGAPLFLYALLIFPILVASGLALSAIGYLSNRRRMSLAAMAVGGVAVIWVVLFVFILPSTTGCTASTIEIKGTVESLTDHSITVNGQTVAITTGLLPLPADISPGTKVHIWATRAFGGGLTACGIGVEDETGS